MPKLLKLRKQEKLKFLGIINSDYTAPRSENEDERFIYNGVVGKLLPSFYIIGDPTHVGEPFRGIDANQIASELVTRLNLNIDFCDKWSNKKRRSFVALLLTAGDLWRYFLTN